jgi:glycosyltransferase involved in cell wall biosynthesis
MSKTKVAIMLVSPGKAGVESVVYNIFKHFKSEQVELYLICSSEIAPYYSEVIDSEKCLILGTFFNKPNNKYLQWANRYWKHKFKSDEKKLNRWAQKALKFIDKHKITCMHANLVWDYQIASSIKEIRPDLTYINTMHGTLALDPTDDYFPFFPRPTIIKMLSNVDLFISACQYFIDLLQLRQVPLRKTVLIPNGIDENLTHNYLSDTENKVVKLCFMGGGRPHQKGGDILIYALKLLIDQHKLSNFKLHIFGNVPAQSKERELANDLKLNAHIEWRGFIEPPKHLIGMEESDIFVLPSRHEGVANTLMEAIGMGMPIVATKVGGTHEVITNEVNGLLCFPDAHDLAEKLAILIKNASLREKMSHANQAIRSRYTWTEICKHYEKAYINL